jgi:hypothetical protein
MYLEVMMEFLVVIIIVVALGAIVLGLFFNHDAKVKRAIRNVPKSEIANVSGGQIAKIVGEISYIKEPLISPLTGRPCACYEIIVEEYKSNGKSGSWRKIIHEQDRRDFLVSDGTGRALIKVEGAKISFHKDTHMRSGTFNDATPELNEYLQKHGKESTTWIGTNKSLRYKEGILEAKESIAICGYAQREPDADAGNAAGYRDQPTRLAFENQGESNPLYISDDSSVLY